jgi:hypothetical protein
MQYECMMPCNKSVLYVPHQKKKNSPNIDGVRIVGGKVVLITVVSSRGMTYANMISILTEEHNVYMTYIITYPPCGTHAFNAARIVLHTLQECIHVSRKGPKDIPRSPRPRCTVMVNRMIDT